ncbi:MAG: hypothetical protein ACFFB9_12750 [Promethearchaeota archaeon]
MSKTILWQYNEFIQSRKEKVVNILISEIIFLKNRAKTIKREDDISYLENALDKLEYLLIKLKDTRIEIPEKDFDKFIMLIYHIFKGVIDYLEEDIRV